MMLGSAKPKNGTNLRKETKIRKVVAAHSQPRPLTWALRAAACCSWDLLRAWLKGSLRKRVFLCTTCLGFLNNCSSSGTPGGWRRDGSGVRGWGAPPLPHTQGLKESPSHSPVNRSMKPGKAGSSLLPSPITHRPFCPEADQDPSKARYAREHRCTHPKGPTPCCLPVLPAHPLGST